MYQNEKTVEPVKLIRWFAQSRQASIVCYGVDKFRNFISIMIGLIITVYSIHYVVGLLVFFGGFYTTLMSLPHYKERIF